MGMYDPYASNILICLCGRTKVWDEAGFQMGRSCDATWCMAHWRTIHDARNGVGQRIVWCRRSWATAHNCVVGNPGSHLHIGGLRRQLVRFACGDAGRTPSFGCAGELDTSHLRSVAPRKQLAKNPHCSYDPRSLDVADEAKRNTHGI